MLTSFFLNHIDMGKVYQRLIVDTMNTKEDYVDGILRVYNNELCDVIIRKMYRDRIC